MGSILVESTWTCLQDVLHYRARSDHNEGLLLYPLGNISVPQNILYSTLYTQAKKYSALIQSLDDFQERRPILLHLNSHWDSILWFWAVLLAKGVPVLSTPFSNVDYQRQKHIQAVSTLLESPICITAEDSILLFGSSHNMSLYTIESLMRNNVPAKQNHERSFVNTAQFPGSDDLAVLMFTSGSTGNAKAVCLTHKQMLASISGKTSMQPLPFHRPFLNWIGLDHVANLMEIHLQALWLGVSQVHVHAADVVSSPSIFLDLLSRHRVSVTFAPNFFLARLVSTIRSEGVEEASKWDFTSLVRLVSGGEANDMRTCVTVSALLQKHGAPRNALVIGFGMTETCAGSIYNLNCPDYDVENGYTVASIGKCIDGTEMRVTTAASDMTDITLAPTNETGNLEVRGDVVFRGYYRNSVATKAAFTVDGWFRTGDRAMSELTGHLRLMGRTNDVININGVKILASNVQDEIEKTVDNRVARLFCFPSRAADTEQVTVAYVPHTWPIEPERVLEIEELIAQICMVDTASHPFVFAIREESLPLLPISALGKISRAKMQALFQAGIFDEDVTLYQGVLRNGKDSQRKMRKEKLNQQEFMSETEAEFLKDFMETVGVSADDIDADTPIFTMGFTSMDLIRLKHRIDGRLNISVPLITLMKHSTARALASVLQTNLKESNIATQSSPDSQYDPVVTFCSQGSRTPLWLVHPGVGEILVFVGLAHQLADNDRPIYALRARGFEEGDPRFNSIGEVVETYVAAIRSTQPRGPYALAGYSYGTMLAFEIAKKLENDGVCFLGSFNLPPHIKYRMRQLTWNMCLLHLAHFLGLTTEAYAQSLEEKVFRTLSRDGALAQVFQRADKGRIEELGLAYEGLARWADVAYGLQSMAIDYDPSGMVDTIDVFHAIPLKAAAQSRKEWVEDRLGKWKDFCLTEPRFHEVDGEHYTMLGPHHVVNFAITLKVALEERGI